MTFPKRSELPGGEFTQIEFNNGQILAQQKDTTEVITRKNRNDFLELINKATDLEGVYEQGGLKIQLLNTALTVGGKRFYFKLNLQGHDYFVKKTSSKQLKEFGGGANELIVMNQAKSLLAGLQGVRVAGYKLGYQDKEYSYLISDYNENLAVTLEQYLLSEPINIDDIEKRVEKIKKILQPHFQDVKDYNMSYDKDTDEIVIFDLFTKPQSNVEDDFSRVVQDY